MAYRQHRTTMATLWSRVVSRRAFMDHREETMLTTRVWSPKQLCMYRSSFLGSAPAGASSNPTYVASELGVGAKSRLLSPEPPPSSDTSSECFFSDYGLVGWQSPGRCTHGMLATCSK